MGGGGLRVEKTEMPDNSVCLKPHAASCGFLSVECEEQAHLCVSGFLSPVSVYFLSALLDKVSISPLDRVGDYISPSDRAGQLYLPVGSGR